MELNEIERDEEVETSQVPSGRRAFSSRKLVLVVAAFGLGNSFKI